MNYSPQGVCSTAISWDVTDGKLHNVAFENGCNGNLKAVGRLVEGRPVEEVIGLLKGITCKSRPTSCGDQFARALEQYLQNSKE